MGGWCTPALAPQHPASHFNLNIHARQKLLPSSAHNSGSPALFSVSSMGFMANVADSSMARLPAHKVALPG
eukprot:4526587-Ditylum_brightwellii.AAC.2